MTTPLANRTYRRLFTAQVIALVGTGLSTIALALIAYDLAGGNAGMARAEPDLKLRPRPAHCISRNEIIKRTSNRTVKEVLQPQA